jgi:SAM-dependent methyltransferase
LAFTYRTVVPWGRSFEEYGRMFDLSENALGGRILGCGDGPASFNCEMARRGRRVVSIDPIYTMSRAQIARRIDETHDDVIRQTRQETHRFVWDVIRSVEELARVRRQAMQTFLDDYETGSRQGRYVAGGLPALPFRCAQFDLALCSHLLFFYAEQLSLTFHLESIDELCRVAREVRIFPLVDVNGHPSPRLPAALNMLEARPVELEIRPVPYEFQRGGNEMLRIRTWV